MGYEVRSRYLLKDGKPVPYKATPNIGGLLKPDTIVMHYTGSSSYAGAVNWLCDKRAVASAHLVIADDGSVTQLAPFDRVTWHAGKSKWGMRVGMNQYAIGIELVNPGLLAQIATGRFKERLSGAVWPAAKTVIAAHKNGGGMQPWALYDPRQLDEAMLIARAIVAAYKIKEVIGHDDIAPIRKTDPGPAFPMSSFEGIVLGRK